MLSTFVYWKVLFLKFVDKIVLLINQIFHAFLCPAHHIHLDTFAVIFFTISAGPAHPNHLNIPYVTLYKHTKYATLNHAVFCDLLWLRLVSKNISKCLLPSFTFSHLLFIVLSLFEVHINNVRGLNSLIVTVLCYVVRFLNEEYMISINRLLAWKNLTFWNLVPSLFELITLFSLIPSYPIIINNTRSLLVTASDVRLDIF